MIGKRRENKWSDERCMFCGGENGGMRHVVLECEGKGIREARERVLERIGKEVPGEVWSTLGREEKLWCTLGKEVEGCEVREKCPEVWKEEWEKAKRAATTEKTKEARREVTTKRRTTKRMTTKKTTKRTLTKTSAVKTRTAKAKT